MKCRYVLILQIVVNFGEQEQEQTESSDAYENLVALEIERRVVTPVYLNNFKVSVPFCKMKNRG